MRDDLRTLSPRLAALCPSAVVGVAAIERGVLPASDATARLTIVTVTVGPGASETVKVLRWENRREDPTAAEA